MARRPPSLKNLTAAQRRARRRAQDAVRYMRSDGDSLSRAAARARTTPKTVRHYMGSVVYRDGGRRYQAKPSDRFTRVMTWLTPDGNIEGRIQGSRNAHLVALYWAAVDAFGRTGGTNSLKPFRNRSIVVNGVRRRFVTDPRTLKRLAAVGEIRFEELYVDTV